MSTQRPRSLLGGRRSTRRDGGGAEWSLVEEIGLNDPEIRDRKAWLQFTEEDVDRLKDANAVAAEYADRVVDDLYEHFLANPDTREFFRDEATLKRVKSMQHEYFFQLTLGEYGRDYVENRLRVGATHGRIGLAPKWYLGAYNLYLRTAGSALFNAYKNQPAKFLDTFFSMMKLVFFDMGLAIDTYMYTREATIRQQQEAIKELSTPVLQLRPELLMLPIVGVLDSNRARQLTDDLLRTIRATRAKVVVMDITGVAAVDSKVANHILQTVDSTRLMGARVIVTGLSPEVAQTITQVGVDTTRLHVAGDLQGGIEEAERLLGYRTVRVGADAAPTPSAAVDAAGEA